MVALVTTLVAGLLLAGAVGAQGGAQPTPVPDFTGRINFSGVVQSLPVPGGAGYGYGEPTPFVGIWRVQGLSVDVIAETHVHGDPHVGSLVRVVGTITPDGVVHAKNINTIKKGKHVDDDDVEFTGNVESLPSGTLIGTWTVSGRRVEVSDQTEIKGAPQVGSLVKVEGAASDGAVQAEEVKVVNAPDKPAATPKNKHADKHDDDDEDNDGGRGQAKGQAAQAGQAQQNNGNQGNQGDNHGRGGDSRGNRGGGENRRGGR